MKICREGNTVFFAMRMEVSDGGYDGAGCDKRRAYVVVCRDGAKGCFATDPGQFLKK